MKDTNDSNIIFSYTWNDAVRDGTFIDVSETAKECGFKFPVAITSNLFYTHIKNQNGRLWDTLWMLKCAAKKTKDSFIKYQVIYGNETITLWAVCEARSPDNPEPVLTIMLPEDY
jgi:hypothetical protein